MSLTVEVPAAITRCAGRRRLGRTHHHPVFSTQIVCWRLDLVWLAVEVANESFTRGSFYLCFGSACCRNFGFVTRLDGVESTQAIVGYEIRGMGGNQPIVIKPDGTIELGGRDGGGSGCVANHTQLACLFPWPALSGKDEE